MLRKVLGLALLIVAMFSGTSEGGQTYRHPKKPLQKKSVVKKPTGKVSLRGSKKVAKHQNTEADKERLTRLRDEAELRRFVETGILVPLPENLFVQVDPRLQAQYRYCRPWTRDFLNDLGKAYHLAHGQPVQVNSAVRTLSRQKVLRRTNGNAAPVAGPYQSSHTTASTIDIAKGDDLQWMRNYLRQKKVTGQIEVVEEFAQPVFHVMVFKNYGQKKTNAQKSKTPARKPLHSKRR